MKTPAYKKMTRVTARLTPSELRSLNVIIATFQKEDRTGSKFGLISRAVGAALDHYVSCRGLAELRKAQ